jgi:hypothetical protein
VAQSIAYPGKIMAGKFVPNDRAAFIKAFLRKDGTPMVVTVKRLVPNRSSQANRYWWGVVVAMFMDEMGIRDKEEVHHIILEEIGHYDIVKFGKKEKKVVKDTHDLPTDDFAVLIDAAGQLFAEVYGGYIPPPNSAQAQAMMGGS